MTRWVSLGPGLTKEDPLWKTHVRMPLGRRAQVDWDDPSFVAHSPRLCFEDEASEPFEDLRSRNLSYLNDRQYKRAMPCIAQLNLWHISYTEPKAGLLQSLLGRLVIARDRGERIRRDSPLPSSPLSPNVLPVHIPWDPWMP